jgi:hypothetical protein
MKAFRQKAKPISVLVTISMLLLVVPYQPCLAAMIGTETALDVAQGQEARQYLKGVLAREDVQKALTAQGIDPREAERRVEALSNAEVVRLAKKVEELPAGGGALGAIIFAGLFVFVVLLVTDILGYTEVFPFVKKHAR